MHGNNNGYLQVYCCRSRDTVSIIEFRAGKLVHNYTRFWLINEPTSGANCYSHLRWCDRFRSDSRQECVLLPVRQGTSYCKVFGRVRLIARCRAGYVLLQGVGQDTSYCKIVDRVRRNARGPAGYVLLHYVHQAEGVVTSGKRKAALLSICVTSD